MNPVNKAFIDKWAASSDLNALLDSSNIVTGVKRGNEEEYPFVTITQQGGVTRFRTNITSGEVYDETLRIVIYGNDDGSDYGTLSEIAHEILSAYYKWEATLSVSRGTIIDTQIAPFQELQDDDDGWWAFTSDMRLKVSYEF